MVLRPPCCECEASSPAYRCPTCCNFYCSASCCQQHKTKNCTPFASDDTNVNEDAQYQHHTDDTVDLEKLTLLGHSTELSEILKDSQLRTIMKDINNHSNPNKAIKFYMQQPNFSRFVDVILKTIEPPKDEAS
ncbi:zinc finger HIT domain-containing protein 3 [Arctopsyche grandis]|uniref:zinc finger HIT domain-containing protein 3 n=1 Tax=Arctopsyche grandis TaxID=121162 RepID=UPI00406DA0DE